MLCLVVVLARGRALVASMYVDTGHRALRKAALSLRSDALPAAQSNLRKALVLQPVRWDAWWGLGLAQELAGQPDLALASLRAAERSAPGNHLVLFDLGGLYSQMGQLTQAVEAWRLAHAEPYFLQRAQTYASEGQPALAEASFDLVRQIRPDWAEPYYGLGDLFWQEGNRERALSPYKEAILRDPVDSARKLHSVARVAWLEGKVQEAVGAYRSALNVGPARFQLYYELQQLLYTGQRDMQGALAVCQQAGTRFPYSIWPLMWTGDIYLAAQDYAGAFYWYKQAGRLDTDSSYPLLYCGIALMLAGNDVDARDYLERSVAINGADARARAELSTVYYRLGMRDEAKQEILRAISLAPDVADYQTRLSQMR
jgi:tetratricopeptide (TPR) repeat protein